MNIICYALKVQQYKTFLILILGLNLSFNVLSQQRNIDTSFLVFLKSSSKFAETGQEIKISHEHTSSKSGMSHTYYQQKLQGIDIYQAVMSVHRDKYGKVLYTNSNWIKESHKKYNTLKPSISIEDALLACARLFEIDVDSKFNSIQKLSYQAKDRKEIWTNDQLSNDDINVRLVFYIFSNNDLRLCWELSYEDLSGLHWWNVRIDAMTGNYYDKNDWTSSCSFDHLGNNTAEKCLLHKFDEPHFLPRRVKATMMTAEYAVYPLKTESPSHGNRDTLIDPSFINGSPYAWHDDNGTTGNEYTYTKGNNVESKEDRGGDNETSGGTFAEGGTNLDFRFPINLTQPPVTNQNAMISNLFYWNNIMHDVWYQYGFDEASGNFQTNNYGNPGAANDIVRADALDGGGRNNANFSTPPDGNKPRMQMYLWDAPGTSNSFTITSPTNTSYSAARATCGPFNYNITGGQIVATNPLNACTSITNATAINGKIALIDRSGSCNHGVQILNAQNAGAIAVVICHNISSSSPLVVTGGANTDLITIPVVMISQANCTTIRSLLTSNTVLANLTATVPTQRDGDLDNGIIAHEYGHGISTRLTGGAANSNCLTNSEQMGEGWSDWFGLMLNMNAADSGVTGKGIGTYALSQPTTGTGIRQFKYSTSLTTNPHTYNSIKTVAIPHGIGSVWCAMLWEMTWKLIDLHGFDPDLYNGTGGNNIAMALVIEGLKLQPCSPGFVDGRDAILMADIALYGGVHQCLIWEAFAKRGLGYGATQGSSFDRSDGIESYILSPTCYIDPKLTADKNSLIENETLTFKARVSNVSDAVVTNVIITDTIPTGTTFISATDGGTFDGFKVSYPSVSIDVNDSIVRYFTIKVDNTTAGGLYTLMDGAENSLSDNWIQNSLASATGTWSKVSTEPKTGIYSYFAPDSPTPNELFLTVNPLRRLRSNSELSFWHSYNTEQSWDGGRIQISTNKGVTWTDLGPLITQNGYNGILDNSSQTPGFTGNSGGYVQTKVNLASFVNQNIIIRFWMHCDAEVGGIGWHIDDISLSNMQGIITNYANIITSQTASYNFNIDPPILLNNCSVVSNTNDTGEGSLHFAYDCVEAGDTVRFAKTVMNQIINLSNSLVIDKDLSFENILPGIVTINNTSPNPTLLVESDINVTIKNITVKAGTGITGRSIKNKGNLICNSIVVIDPLSINTNGSGVLNEGFMTIIGTLLIKP